MLDVSKRIENTNHIELPDAPVTLSGGPYDGVRLRVLPEQESMTLRVGEWEAAHYQRLTPDRFKYLGTLRVGVGLR